MRTSAPHSATSAFGPLFAGILAALACVGCATTQRAASPEATLTELAKDLEAGDLKAAYARHSDDYKKRVSFETFRARIEQSPKETKATSEQVKRTARVRTRATIELTNGQTVELEQKAGRWLIDSPLLDFYSQESPRDALHSFTRAVRNKRWDVLMALMPDRDRQGMTAEVLQKGFEAQWEEIERLVALLEASANDPIEEVGDRATMPFGESFTARFVRENGLWKVEDPE